MCQRSVMRWFSCAMAGSRSSVRSCGWPTSTTRRSFSVAVSRFESRRSCSSRSTENAGASPSPKKRSYIPDLPASSNSYRGKPHDTPARRSGAIGSVAPVLLRWDSGGPSPRVAKLPLVSDREDTNLVACGDEAVERDVSRSAERDHELSQLALHSPPDERVLGQSFDRAPDRGGSPARDRGVVPGEELERALEVGDGRRGVDYVRHGRGRAGRRAPALRRASRSSHAWTSPAAYTSPVRSILRSAAAASATNARRRSSCSIW